MSFVYQNILEQTEFVAPSTWMRITTIDMHTGGEPLRVIVSGFPELIGGSVLQYRRYIQHNFDHLRKFLLFEPRGHADMYGCILTPPNDDQGDFGVVFMHNEGYSTMCGHAIIAISTLAVQMHWVEVKEGDNQIVIDAPCGRIISQVNVKGGEVIDVIFQGVPSFVIGLDRTVQIDGVGPVLYDLAYGGAFYAYVDLNKNHLDLDLSAQSYHALISLGRIIKAAVIRQDQDIHHPFEDDLSFLYGTIFIGDSINKNAHSRNVCVFADGEVDRSPTGSGVSGRMAIHWARNEIQKGEIMKIESITRSIFTGSVIAEQPYGNFQSVIPEVGGTAYITGMNTFIMDPKDPIREGFILR